MWRHVETVSAEILERHQEDSQWQLCFCILSLLLTFNNSKHELSLIILSIIGFQLRPVSFGFHTLCPINKTCLALANLDYNLQPVSNPVVLENRPKSVWSRPFRSFYRAKLVVSTLSYMKASLRGRKSWNITIFVTGSSWHYQDNPRHWARRPGEGRERGVFWKMHLKFTSKLHDRYDSYWIALPDPEYIWLHPVHAEDCHATSCTGLKWIKKHVLQYFALNS